MGRHKSNSTSILVTGKESMSLEQIGNGKICPVTARQPLRTELHTRSGWSVVTGTNRASVGLSCIGIQRPLTQVTWQTRAYRHAAATHKVTWQTRAYRHAAATHMVTWQTRAYRHAAATDSPHLASSEYRLARLRADMTLSVHLCFQLILDTRNLCCFALFSVQILHAPE